MTVLVTGASGGIGRAAAVRLAEDGHDVAVNYRTDEAGAEETASAVESAGQAAVTVEADVRETDAVEAMVEDLAERFDGIDAVVNNAGITRPATVEELTDDDWAAVLETNLSGAFRVARATAPHLRRAGGDLVNVSSVGGTAGTVDASYAASKSGLHGLTRALARELGPDGVQVNAVAPGPVETPMNAEIVDYLESVDFRGHENVDTHLPEYACSPETVADAIAYLVATPYVHGEIHEIDGGMHF
jgi:3-oxoacyl-[acyl-carrier protein] reductase